MTAAGVPDALRDYLARIDELTAAYTPSVFWQRQLEQHGAHDALAPGAALTAADLDRYLATAGYGFEPLADDDATPRDDDGLAEAQALLKRHRDAAKAVDRLWKAADQRTAEHARALGFLARRELLDAYLDDIADLGARSSMSLARHWWYAREIDALLTREGVAGPLRILEVGAGAGNLLVMLARRGRVAAATVVDLPEMLVGSAWTLHRHLADLPIGFGPQAGTPLRFLQPGELDAVEDGSVDLCLNANSFMEMDRDARDGYLRAWSRVTADGGLTWNVNRRQHLPQPDGSVFDNHPLRYPYDPSDEVLLWEEDAFQQESRARIDRLPSLAILRAARVRRGS